MKTIRLLPRLLACAALTLPAVAQSDMQIAASNTTSAQNGVQTRGGLEAMQMVPAQAMLKRGLDAQRVATGSQFRATLTSKVQLANGPELPRGTVLIGTVTNDDMNITGTAKLALRFDEALLKNGMTVPIKATIVQAYKPSALADYSSVAQSGTAPNDWNDGTLQVDQIGVSKDVDLHARIASKNSGVFVATHDKDVKLPAGSQFNLAIAAQTNPTAITGL